MKPGQPGSNQGKSGFVICEICDGYIKDLEQLRNHMQWIHKVMQRDLSKINYAEVDYYRYQLCWIHCG